MCSDFVKGVQHVLKTLLVSIQSEKNTVQMSENIELPVKKSPARESSCAKTLERKALHQRRSSASLHIVQQCHCHLHWHTPLSLKHIACPQGSTNSFICEDDGTIACNTSTLPEIPLFLRSAGVGNTCHG